MSEDDYTRKFNPKAFYGKKKKHDFETLSENIIGAAIIVHKELGPGFLESIYEEALKVELSKNHINFERQVVVFCICYLLQFQYVVYILS